MGSAQAAAEVPTLPELTASLTASSLTMDWAGKSAFESFVVIDEHTTEVVQSGSATSLTQTMGQPDSVSMLVFGIDDGNSSLLGKVLAVTPEPGSSLFPAVTVATEQGTHLDWEPVPGVSAWTVETDLGGPVAALTTELDLPPALTQEHRIDIIGEVVVDGKLTKLVNGFSISPPLVAASSIGPSLAEGDIAPASVVTVKTSRFQYDAYNPSQYVNAPDSPMIPDDCESGDGSDYWYGGDNRGLEYNSPRFRTRAVNQYMWGIAMITEKTVSPTKRYVEKSDGTKVYESSRTASDAGLVVKGLSMDRGQASGTIYHKVTNPYCDQMNAIDYRQTHDVYQGGGYRVSGSHDKMPNHHFYRRNFMSDGTVQNHTVFHHPLKSPLCLHLSSRLCRGEWGMPAVGIPVRAMSWMLRFLTIAAALAAGYFCLLAAGLAGWSLPGTRREQFMTALPALAVSGMFGAAAMLLALVALGSRKYAWLVLGLAPAVIQAVLILM